MARKKKSKAAAILWAVLAVILAYIILHLGVKAAKWVGTKAAAAGTAGVKGFLALGQAASSTPIKLPGWGAKIISVVLGPTQVTWEQLILHLAVFFIIFFALSEIIMGFSSFSDITAYIIGFGLALIAGVTKTIKLAAAALGLGAGVGAIGIVIIVISSIFAAVVLNLGVGAKLQEWRTRRQQAINEFKTEAGFAEAASGIKGAKDIARAARE